MGPGPAWSRSHFSFPPGPSPQHTDFPPPLPGVQGEGLPEESQPSTRGTRTVEARGWGREEQGKTPSQEGARRPRAGHRVRAQDTGQRCSRDRVGPAA